MRHDPGEFACLHLGWPGRPARRNRAASPRRGRRLAPVRRQQPQDGVHHQQKLAKLLGAMTVYESEFQAFKAQQRFLELLPTELVPDDMVWLLRATDADLETHVLSAYADMGAFKPWGFRNEDMADAVIALISGGATK